MRAQMMVGILLTILGAFIVFRGVDAGSQRSVIQVGELRASVEGRRTMPVWVGAAAIAGGLLLVAGAGLQRRPRRA